MRSPAPEPMSAVALGEMRRGLLRILNEVELQRDPTERENVCDRIQRLCRNGTIPESIGDLMHVVRKSRNRAEYQDCLPEGMEAQAIRSAWAAIENWRLKRTSGVTFMGLRNGLPRRRRQNEHS